MSLFSRRFSPFFEIASVATFLVVMRGEALAQTKEADAERLFREGQKLLEQKRFGEACPKFQAAYDKDGQLGTLINLAFCHKAQGARWYAWLEFREAEIKATELGREDHRSFIRTQLAALDKQLPKVVVDNPAKIPLTAVQVEERRVPEAETGAPFAIEPGDRKLTFLAEGKKPATVIVEVVRGNAAQHVVVPTMEDVPPEPEPVAQPSPPPPDPSPAADTSKAEMTPHTSGNTQRTLGWVALGVGGAGLVAGAISGAMTLSNPCAGSIQGCTRESRDDADRSATISDLSFVVAGVGIVAGVTLLLTAPSRTSTSDASPDVARNISPRLGLGWAGVDGVF